MTVREAGPADVPGIRRVAREGWYAAYGDFLADGTVERVELEVLAENAVARRSLLPLAVARGNAVGGRFYGSCGFDAVGKSADDLFGTAHPVVYARAV